MFKNTCAILFALLLSPAALAQPTRPLADVLLDLGSASPRLALRIATQQAREQWRMDRGPLYKSTPVKENGDPSVVTDDLFFDGTFLPASDKSALAVFSDDGCDVWIDDKLVMNNFKKGQHLPALNQSFHVVNGGNGRPFPFRKGKSYQIKIRYSNTVFNGKTDIDGLTVFAYNGGGDSVRVSLLVDTNRDGVVNESDDEAGKDAYTKMRGALFIPNYDRDRGNVHAAAAGTDDVPAGENAPDALDFGPDGKPYPASETKTIKNASDAADIAPLVIRPLEGPLPTGAKVFLTLADADEAKAIHVYKKIAPGETAFWGGLAETETEKDITAMVSLTADTTFGVEGLYFRNTGDVNKFKGEVNFTLELRVPDKGGTLITTSSDKVKLTVSPYMLLPNTLDASKVWMTTDPRANDIAAAFGGLSQRRVPNTGSQWFQDHVQIGYTSFPNPANKQMRLTLQMPYPPQDLWPRRNLLEKGEGFYRFRNTASLDRTGSGASGTFGGNLEVIPPTKDWPLGRIIVGSTMIRPNFSTTAPETKLYDFLTSQRVQKPFSVNVHWLQVGHVDEVMNIVPGGGANGFRIGRASPRYARELLEKGDAARGVAAPADYVSMFATGAEDHGQASNAITTNSKIWLFDGVAHGRVRCVAKANINDGETIAISDGAKKMTFEFDTDGKVGKGNVKVDISGSTTAGDVRDQLRAVINGAAAFNVRAYDDGADSLVIINNDFGKAGNKTITTTVKNAGFTVQGMKGGKAAADGKDFTTKTWKFVRIHNATGAGQVAQLDPARDLHKGWVTVNNLGVFYTTSRIVVDTSIAPSPKSLELYLESRDPVPADFLWETEPDSTSQYLLAEDCQIWDHSCVFRGARIQQAVPALYSVGEMKRETTLWKLNLAADDEAIATRDAIRTNMGAGSIPLEDFLRLPVIFLGHWDGTKIVERTALAYVPGGQNFQPSSPGTVVFAKQFGPRQGGVDIFQKVIRSKVAGAKFADDWSLYHILEGEVHCGTEVTRAFPGFSWWQRQPAP
jgi:hypothetical protein